MYPNGVYQRGVGLIASIFLLVIMTVIVLALSSFTQTSSRGFGQDLNSQRAFYAAEAGVEITLHSLSLNGASCDSSIPSIDFSNLPSGASKGLENCRATITCNPVVVGSVATWRIVAQADCGYGFEQAQRSIQVQARDL